MEGHQLLFGGKTVAVYGDEERSWEITGHEGGCECGARPMGFPVVGIAAMQAWHGMHVADHTAATVFITYQMADGSPIYGEFDFVTDLVFFDDREEEVRLTKRTYRLVSEEEVVLEDPYPLVEDDDDRPATD